jgi:hypothetical protein
MGTDAAVKGSTGCRTNNFIQRRFIMKRVTKIAIGAVAALSLGLAAAAVNAHPHGYGPGWGMGQGQGQEYGPGAGMGPGMGHMGRGPMGQGMGPHGHGNPSAMADARNAYFKSELKITPAQEPAWKAYADQKKQQVEAMQALRTTAQGSKQATAPERLELRNQIMKKRQEQVEKETSAFKDLYAVLNPEQKALADQRVGLGMMGGRGMAFNRPAR